MKVVAIFLVSVFEGEHFGRKGLKGRQHDAVGINNIDCTVGASELEGFGEILRHRADMQRTVVVVSGSFRVFPRGDREFHDFAENTISRFVVEGLNVLLDVPVR